MNTKTLLFLLACISIPHQTTRSLSLESTSKISEDKRFKEITSALMHDNKQIGYVICKISLINVCACPKTGKKNQQCCKTAPDAKQARGNTTIHCPCSDGCLCVYPHGTIIAFHVENDPKKSLEAYLLKCAKDILFAHGCLESTISFATNSEETIKSACNCSR